MLQLHDVRAGGSHGGSLVITSVASVGRSRNLGSKLTTRSQMLLHIRDRENYLDAVFLEGVTLVRVTASNLLCGQDEGVTASEAGKGIELTAVLQEILPLGCQAGLRFLLPVQTSVGMMSKHYSLSQGSRASKAVLPAWL